MRETAQFCEARLKPRIKAEKEPRWKLMGV